MSNNSFHLIITTHSTLCEGYRKAAELIIMNDQSGLTLLPFEENMPSEEFERRMAEIVKKHASQSLVILTDLIGGTPNNTAIKQLGSPNIQVITGFNLPLLLELLMAQSSDKQIEELNIPELIKSAQDNIIHVNSLIAALN
ncbi:MAG: PTS sugar transporter subunit IIA [Enterococcus avium]